MRSISLALAAALLIAAAPPDATPADPAAFRADAESFEPLVNQRYAYLDRFPGARFTLTPALAAEAAAVHDHDSLLRFLERGIALLVDHHAITGSALADSWGLVPSYADLWAVEDGAGLVVSDVRPAMPAAGKVFPGDRVVAVDGTPIVAAVAAWWGDLGVAAPTREQREFAARVLLAGRRDRERHLTFAKAGTLTLANLYSARRALGPQPPVTTTHTGTITRITLNDSLGVTETIPAFDAAMAAIPPGSRLELDLTDTGSGGTSTIARAIMGWFTATPRPYQMHASPEELRATGIARQWAEYVVPRPGKRWTGPVIVRVGRWTGSMGEGLAVGLDALGIPVCGTPMAGLLGAIEDNRLDRSGQVVKFPTERLTTIAGTPREKFQPRPTGDPACRLPTP